MELRFFEIYRSPEYLGLLAEGAAMSAGLTALSGLLGFVCALGLSLSRHARIPVLRHVAAVYVEVVRNTPLIVQLFFVAFGLPMLLGYQWPFWAHAVLALTLNFSAYFAEILRAGYQGVDKGQLEAAEALGVRRGVIFTRIVLPQAVARMFPSLGSQFIFLFLTTAVISEIGVRDLTNAGLFIDSRTFRSFEVFITLTILYIAISLAFKGLMAWAESRLFRWKEAR
ncbi:amino acid ABC transporter permease [Rhodovulum sp. DZ06]|uniref:amino acid ABC transporter permease n=1 Tax=Rhodovulum sp. DZ06 TaxID=3425126 RepID=UPI003D32D189